MVLRGAAAAAARGEEGKAAEMLLLTGVVARVARVIAGGRGAARMLRMLLLLVGVPVPVGAVGAGAPVAWKSTEWIFLLFFSTFGTNWMWVSSKGKKALHFTWRGRAPISSPTRVARRGG